MNMQDENGKKKLDDEEPVEETGVLTERSR